MDKEGKLFQQLLEVSKKACINKLIIWSREKMFLQRI